MCLTEKESIDKRYKRQKNRVLWDYKGKLWNQVVQLGIEWVLFFFLNCVGFHYLVAKTMARDQDASLNISFLRHSSTICISRIPQFLQQVCLLKIYFKIVLPESNNSGLILCLKEYWEEKICVCVCMSTHTHIYTHNDKLA